MADGDARILQVVAAALVDVHGRVLVQQRPAGKHLAGLWEFPGGKLEPGEAPEVALARELLEELGIMVSPDAMTSLAFASTLAGKRRVLLLLYSVRDWNGEPVAHHAAELRWVTPAAMGGLRMPPADVPLVAALARALG